MRAVSTIALRTAACPGLALVAMLAAATMPVAHADNALRPERIPNKARELVTKGRKAHKAGDYTAAVSAFKEAYVLAPSPGLLFNIAQAYRLAGNCDEAAWMYRRFLDTDPKGTHRRLAENHLSAVEKCGTGGLRITVTPPRLEAKVPLPASASASAGASAGALERVPRLDDVAPGERNTRLKQMGTYTMAGGGAALIGAAIFAYDAHRAASSVEETYKRGGRWSDVANTDARGQRSASYAKMLGVGGGVAAISGAVMYGLGRHYEQARHVEITPTAGGARVSLSWGF
jgi:tetratricopeptide (TPR) repeat protein